MFDISDAIKSVGETFTSLFNWLKTNKEEQCETEIIKEVKRQRKGLDIAEDIISLIFSYIDYFTQEDKQKFLKLHEKFKKYN